MHKGLTICFLLIGQLACAQMRHEIKADALLFSNRLARFSYEILPTARWGIELDVLLRKDLTALSLPSVISFENYYYEFKQQELHLSIASKYYFLEKYPGAGPFVGVYFHSANAIIREKSYREAYRLNFRKSPPALTQVFAGLGVLAGYKQLIAHRLVIEPSIGVAYGYCLYAPESIYYLDFRPILGLKLGYCWSRH